MHMSDALVSPAVAAVAGTVSLTLLGTAILKTKRQQNENQTTQGERIVPLMGVMGAFVFAAQMINFSIPGTGSSGHIVGGILLSAVLGPWAAFITLSSVLVIQCLVFADGGFMAMGCNILNMAAFSCLVAYPLIFKPIMRTDASTGRIFRASLTASVAGLELGALAVTVETGLSGIAALPMGRFLLFMLPIHLLIGIGEGLATAAVLCVVRKYRPELLADTRKRNGSGTAGRTKTLVGIALTALLIGGSFSWIASSAPDGLEWSVARTAGPDEPEATGPSHRTAASIRQATAIMPDYDTSLAGIAGCGAILLVAFGVSHLFRPGRKQE